MASSSTDFRGEIWGKTKRKINKLQEHEDSRVDFFWMNYSSKISAMARRRHMRSSIFFLFLILLTIFGVIVPVFAVFPSLHSHSHHFFRHHHDHSNSKKVSPLSFSISLMSSSILSFCFDDTWFCSLLQFLFIRLLGMFHFQANCLCFSPRYSIQCCL